LIFAIHVPSSYGVLPSRGHGLIFAIHVPSSYGALS
jgi:hypothetical protein